MWGYRRRARLGAKYVTQEGHAWSWVFASALAPYVADAAALRSAGARRSASWSRRWPSCSTALSIREQLPQIEVAVADNAVALVLRVLDAPTAHDLASCCAFAHAHGVRLYLQPGGLDSGAPTRRRAGEPLRYALPQFDLELEFAPTDFIQVNGGDQRGAGRRARSSCWSSTAGSAVLDLFCGLGNFTLPLARRGGRVVGVEGDAALVERARGNARRNGIGNAEFHVADLVAAPAADRARGGSSPYTHVLLDPPRAGAREMLATVAALAPQRLLYISCHPGSLARDLGILVHEHGFAFARQAWSTCFRTPRTSNRWRCSAGKGRPRRLRPPAHEPRAADDRPGGDRASPPKSASCCAIRWWAG